MVIIMVTFTTRKIMEVVRDTIWNETRRIGGGIDNTNMWGPSWEVESQIWDSVSDFLYDT